MSKKIICSTALLLFLAVIGVYSLSTGIASEHSTEASRSVPDAHEQHDDGEHHEGGHEEHGSSGEIYRVFNALLLFGLPLFLFRKKIAAFFSKREKVIKTDFEQAEVTIERQKSSLEELESAYSRIDERREKIEEAIAAKSEEEKRLLKDKSEKEQQKSREQFEKQLKEQEEQLRRDIAEKGLNKALELVEKRWKSEISQEDQRRWTNEYIDDFEEAFNKW